MNGAGCHMPFVSAVERGLVRNCKSNSSYNIISRTALIFRLYCYVIMSRASRSSSITLHLGSRTAGIGMAGTGWVGKVVLGGNGRGSRFAISAWVGGVQPEIL